jgi:hypothetical protein
MISGRKKENDNYNCVTRILELMLRAQKVKGRDGGIDVFNEAAKASAALQNVSIYITVNNSHFELFMPCIISYLGYYLISNR